MLPLLVLIVVPVIFCMISWVVFTTSRLDRYDDIPVFERVTGPERRRSRARKRAVSVGSEAEVTDYGLTASVVDTYRLRYDRSTGIPTVWHDELWVRRN